MKNAHRNTLTKKWWDNLDNTWKRIFRNAYKGNAPEGSDSFLETIFETVSLDCSGETLHDLAPISSLTDLHILKCEDCGLTTLEHLYYLKDLQVLRCGGNKIEDLKVLEQMPKLTELDIHDNEVSNLEVLRVLPNLEYLDVSNNRMTVQVHYIQHLLKLKTLSLKGNLIDNVSTIGACTALQRLDISNNSILSIAPLATLSQLAELNMSSNQVKTLQDLYQLPNLEHLDCRDNPLARDEAVFFKIRKKGVNFVTDANTDPTATSFWQNKSTWLLGGVFVVGVSFFLTFKGDVKIAQNGFSNSLSSNNESSTNVAQPVQPPKEVTPLPKAAHKWWKSLSPEWRTLIAHNITRAETDYDATPDAFLQEVYDLTGFDCQEQPLKNLAPLGELKNLLSLDCGNTGCTDYSFLKKMPKIVRLKCYGNKLSSSAIQAIGACTTLQDVDCSKTGISDLAIIKNLKNSLVYFNCSDNAIKNLKELASATNLQRVDCQNNQIQTLQPLYKLEHLFHIDCMGNPIDKTALWLDGDYGCCFDAPSLDIIFEPKEKTPMVLEITKADHNWWQGLSKEWKQVLEESLSDTYEEDPLNFLVELFELEELNVSGEVLQNGNPLRKLKNLTSLSCSNTGFSDFSFLKDLPKLEILDCSNNPINVSSLANIRYCIYMKELDCSDAGLKSLSFLTLQNQRLNTLDCSHNQISSLEPVYAFPLLTEINCAANPPLRQAPWWKNKDYENYFKNKKNGLRIELILE